ncbi:piggyBac transposable element-derived protein 4-like [Dendropsophus ebraccatus]|uniref:piggyBac transposable element-derived protein 4-like n=1 Tax=Dendropsophus ebraccatus TaxID=150705 RepID=UPI0038315D0D
MCSSSSDSETETASEAEFSSESETSSVSGPPSPMQVGSAARRDPSGAGPSHTVPRSLWDQVELFSPQIPPFVATPGINVDVSNFNPYDFFHLFIGDQVLELIVQQTNLYARQVILQNPRSSYARAWVPTTVPEFKKFLGITLNMGLVKKPSVRSYWATNVTNATPVFAAVMNRTRYEAIMRFMHFTDNSLIPPRSDPAYDRLCKLRPLLSLLQHSFFNLYTPSLNLSVDESLMSFKGRLSFRQYIPSKRARYGVKLYKICESSTGYTCGFFIYEGRDRHLNPPGCPEGIGINGKIVWQLMEPYLQKGYHVYTDNYYTSVPLYKALHEANTGACGTVRKNRTGLPQQLVSWRLAKGQSLSFATDQLLAVKWSDKKEVILLTTVHTSTTVAVTERGSTTQKHKPLCVMDYNVHMGGVDLSDQVLQPYLVKRKNKAWYKKVAIYLIQMATYNSYVLYKRQGSLSFLQYQEKVVEHLMFEEPPSADTFQSENVERLTGRHFPHHVPETPNKKYPQKRCRVCRKHGIRRETRFYCPMCPSEPGLCVYPCFEKYHTIVNY